MRLVGVVGWIVLSAACASKAPPAPPHSPALLPAICAGTRARELFESGRLSAALAELKETPTTRSEDVAGCGSSDDWQRLHDELLAALGDCDALKSPALACTANEGLDPRQALERAAVFERQQRPVDAQRVLSRALHSALAKGTEIKPVPHWLQDMTSTTFVAPDRFVVSHTDGTSVVDGQSLQEVTRCPQRTHPGAVSLWGHVAQLEGKQAGLVDLRNCQELSPGQRLLASLPDDRLVVSASSAGVEVMDYRSNTALWSDGNGPGVAIGACIAPSGDRIALSYASGDLQLRDASTGRVLSAIEAPEGAVEVDSIFGLGTAISTACKFSSDGHRIAFANYGTQVRIWDVQSGAVAETPDAYLSELSSDLLRYLMHPRRDTEQKVDLLRHWTEGRSEPLALQGEGWKLQTDDDTWLASAPERMCHGVLSSPEPKFCTTLPAKATVMLEAQTGTWVVQDANRYTVHQPGQEPRVALLPKGREGTPFGNGRWLLQEVERGIEAQRALWDTRELRALDTLVSKSAPDLFFHSQQLCFHDDCLLPGNPDLAFEDVTEPPTRLRTAEYYSRLDLVLGVSASSTGIRSLGEQEAQEWQWPKTGRAHSLSAAEVAFDRKRESVLVLSHEGSLFEFSLDGALKRELDLKQYCPYPQTARMLQAQRAGVVLVTLAERPSCSVVIDQRTGAMRALPFAIIGDAALSADGKRVAFQTQVTDEEDVTAEPADDAGAGATEKQTRWQVVTHDLQSGAEVGRFDHEPALGLGLDFAGRLVALETTGRVGSNYTRAPASLEVLTVDGQSKLQVKLTPPGEFESPFDAVAQVEFGERVFTIGNEVYAYDSKQPVARVMAKGRRILVSYPDARVEVFGDRRQAAYSCLVGTQVLPPAFCAQLVEAPGRLQKLVHGEAVQPAVGRNAAQLPGKAPAPARAGCNEPINVCGNEVFIDSPRLWCWEGMSLDTDQLACLVGLTSLELAGTDFSGFKPEQRLTALRRLRIERSQFADLSLIARASALQELSVAHTQVKDLSHLAKHTSLRDLNIGHTQVTDLAPLAKLQKLQTLRIAGLKLDSLDVLHSLPALKQVTLSEEFLPESTIRALSDRPSLYVVRERPPRQPSKPSKP